jgi:hypothetical protein
MFSKKREFITIAGYTFIFLKIPLPVMYMPVFNFQNMVDMHERFAYQNFQFYCLIKNSQQ